MAEHDENPPAGKANSTLAGTDFEPIDCIPKWTDTEWVSQNLPMVRLSAIMLRKSKSELTVAVQKILADEGVLDRNTRWPDRRAKEIAGLRGDDRGRCGAPFHRVGRARL